MRRSNGYWAPDPYRQHDLRYWDGARWTDQIADGTPRVPTGECDVLPPARISPPDPIWPFPEAKPQAPRTRREAREAMKAASAVRHRRESLVPARSVRSQEAGPADAALPGGPADKAGSADAAGARPRTCRASAGRAPAAKGLTGTGATGATGSGVNRTLGATFKAAAVGGAGAVVVLSGVVSGLWTPWDQGTPTQPGSPGGAASAGQSPAGSGDSGDPGSVVQVGDDTSGGRDGSSQQEAGMGLGTAPSKGVNKLPAAGLPQGLRTTQGGSGPDDPSLVDPTPSVSEPGVTSEPTDTASEPVPSVSVTPGGNEPIPASGTGTGELPTEPEVTVQNQPLTVG
ncbi:MAG: hypothetical protein QG608_670 [Actinomycetota bacterium]|nr:hypothetical protein [Actinomycetota bacterium]